MSKQDSQFFNVFSVVIGGLIAVALVLFAIARSIGIPFEQARAAADNEVTAQVVERIAPVGKIAVAGKDNSKLALVSAIDESAGAGPAIALPANGEETFKAVCGTCHVAGLAGAPKVGDKAAWAPRIAQGKDTLYQHAIAGFQGKAGVMPAKGGRTDLPDDLVKQAVDYMVKMEQ